MNLNLISAITGHLILGTLFCLSELLFSTWGKSSLHHRLMCVVNECTVLQIAVCKE